jgi:hypothetical protein
MWKKAGIHKDPRLEKYLDDLSQIGKMLRGLVKSLEHRVCE